MLKKSGAKTEDLVLTKDNKPLYVRSLRPSDEPLLEDLFESLSPRTIFFRFRRYWKSVPEEIINYFKKVNYDLNVGMVAVEKQPLEERALGLCCILRKPGSVRGEFAVVVRDEWQGVGLGPELLKASLPEARKMGMTEFWGLASTENTTMVAVAIKLGFTLRKCPETDLFEMEMRL